MSAAHYRLYHHPLSPASRRVRLDLAEKTVACDLVLEKPWAPSPDLYAMNPAADLPVLIIDQDGEKLVLSEVQAICEYLEETHAGTLLGKTPLDRAETRRLISWFDHKMQTDVTNLLVGEKADRANPIARSFARGV